METTATSKFAQVEVLFRQHSERVLNYIKSRINDHYDAENLAQDVWMKIMESDSVLCMDTVVSYLYRIASNLINDYLRNLYNRMGVKEEMLQNSSCNNYVTPESEYSARQIEEFENKKIKRLPKQRRIVYIMSRFQDKNVAEIAESLSLSFRTVENHLRLGRRDVRDYISAIA